ncbi:MAG TPA: hypothetical protein VKM55_14065 [Candidatus Lokiarchaeia archaeon]|nr:hypothetical protein [Candidatus Lokiarchaeia archaeon]
MGNKFGADGIAETISEVVKILAGTTRDVPTNGEAKTAIIRTETNIKVFFMKFIGFSFFYSIKTNFYNSLNIFS